jgi:processive 1,2-diacylglycerol beta-glucosyltransferase
MKKILFFPLLQFPSGHHHVADALIRSIQDKDNIECKKIELLSYSSPKVEKMVSSVYLKWIHYAPKTFGFIYNIFGYSSDQKITSVKRRRWFFTTLMDRIIEEEKPDLVVATHSFPSSILSELKVRGKRNIPIINVYTDFFVSDIWGRKGIDYHLVPNAQAKARLIKEGVPSDLISITGIPVDQSIKIKEKLTDDYAKMTVLVAGGSSGLGNIYELMKKAIKSNANITYKVLCGNNKKLYQELKELNSERLQPLPYIDSKEEMSELYDNASAIIVKPGGVTISEALVKRLPIFVHACLPGQEKINLQYLESKHLIYKINEKEPMDQQIFRVLNNKEEQAHLQKRIDTYFQGMEEPTEKLFHALISNKKWMQKTI